MTSLRARSGKDNSHFHRKFWASPVMFCFKILLQQLSSRSLSFPNCFLIATWNALWKSCLSFNTSAKVISPSSCYIVKNLTYKSRQFTTCSSIVKQSATHTPRDALEALWSHKFLILDPANFNYCPHPNCHFSNCSGNVKILLSALPENV